MLTEAGTGSSLADRVSQIGNATRSIVRATCESRFNYWAAYATEFGCFCIFAYLGMQRASSVPEIILSSLFGLFVFSFVEYAVHRWLLHDMRSALFYLHDAHHEDPERTSAFLFPTTFAILMPIWYLLTFGLHVGQASYFLMGFSAGYFYFDTLHHVMHTTRINQIPFRWLKKRWATHSVHHRIARSNYGVITPFWDYLFVTHHQQMKRGHRALRPAVEPNVRDRG